MILVKRVQLQRLMGVGMRLGFKTWILAGFVACAAVPLAADTNLAEAKKLTQIQTQGLKSVGASRLKSLISVPAASTGTAKFTRTWVDKQPKATGGPQFRCLAEALYFEARGETVKGQFAVAEVIRNRVNSTRFPDSFCNVIHQGTGRKYQCQFTYTCDGNSEVINEPAAYARGAKIARAVMDGQAADLVDGATYYHTTAVRPRWAKKFTRTARIGVHLFYRRGVRTASN